MSFDNGIHAQLCVLHGAKAVAALDPRISSCRQRTQSSEWAQGAKRGHVGARLIRRI